MGLLDIHEWLRGVSGSTCQLARDGGLTDFTTVGNCSQRKQRISKDIPPKSGYASSENPEGGPLEESSRLRSLTQDLLQLHDSRVGSDPVDGLGLLGSVAILAL